MALPLTQEGFFCALASPPLLTSHPPHRYPHAEPFSLTIETTYSHLGISYGMQEGPIFAEKSVPRGTLLWNENTQILVSCGKLFLGVNAGMMRFPGLTPSMSITSAFMGLFTFLM